MTGLMNEMSISVPESKESLLMAHFCAIDDDTAENGTEVEFRGRAKSYNLQELSSNSGDYCFAVIKLLVKSSARTATRNKRTWRLSANGSS